MTKTPVARRVSSSAAKLGILVAAALFNHPFEVYAQPRAEAEAAVSSSTAPKTSPTARPGDGQARSEGTVRADAASVFVDIAPSMHLRSLVATLLESVPSTRHRVVRVNGDVIRETIADAAANANTRLILPLFEEVVLVSAPHQAISYTNGPQAGMASWLGTLSRPQDTVFVALRIDGSVRLNAWSHGSWYQILPVVGGPRHAHVIVEIDPRGFEGVSID